MQHHPTPGLLIKDRYKLIQSIGQGSFGEVWLADDIVEKKYVAIKLYQWLDRDGMNTFSKEMETTRDLMHPNLLIPNEFDEWNQRPFLIMEYCGKGSVSCLAGTLSEEMAWKFIRDVASGLAYLHGLYEPIVHQDVKPYNIVISDDNTYKITDFGISTKVRDHLARHSGHRNPNAGALAYMAPERFTPDSSPLTSSDIWAFGVTIFELLSGRLPFSGMGGGMLKGGAEIPKIPQQYSERLDRLVTACMQKETWDRPTASDIEYYASAVLRGESPVGPWEIARPAAAQQPVPPEIKEGIMEMEEFKETALSSNGRWKIMAAAVAGILLAGGLIFAGIKIVDKKTNADTEPLMVSNQIPAGQDALLADNNIVVEDDLSMTDTETEEQYQDDDETEATDAHQANVKSATTEATESPVRQPEASANAVSTAGSGNAVAAGDGYRGPEDTGRPQNKVDSRDFSGKDRNGYVSRAASANPAERRYTSDKRYKKKGEVEPLSQSTNSRQSVNLSGNKPGAPIDNNLRIAVNNGDYATVKKYADAGNVNAYVPMADLCIRNNEYANAEMYAKKAKAAGVVSANRVFELLTKMGYYD